MSATPTGLAAEDLNIEYIGSIPYHTRADDLNIEYIGDIPYHTKCMNMFLEVIMAAPELSPQPAIPYFSLYFET